MVLWVAHTYFWPLRDTTPYISVTSALKREGKTRLMEVAEVMVRSPLRAADLTPAVLYHDVDGLQPTLFIDEQDSTTKMNDRLRKLLNAGYRRGGKVGIRQGHETVYYSVYCPKLIGGIGELPATLRDRSIEIVMRRAMKEESDRLTRFVQSAAMYEAQSVREALLLASMTFEGWVMTAQPMIPPLASNRAEEAWEPLFVIADLAGGTWPNDARDAAQALQSEEETDPLVALLADIRTVFGEEHRLPSVELVGRINALDGAFEGHLSSPKHLAKYLRNLRVARIQMRVGDRNVRGYERAAFSEVWRRYL